MEDAKRRAVRIHCSDKQARRSAIPTSIAVQTFVISIGRFAAASLLITGAAHPAVLAPPCARLSLLARWGGARPTAMCI